MMTKMTKLHNTDVRILIDFCLKNGNYYGEHTTKFKSYVTLFGRSKMIFLLDDWSQVDFEVKTSIWTNFVVLL